MTLNENQIAMYEDCMFLNEGLLDEYKVGKEKYKDFLKQTLEVTNIIIENMKKK